MIRTPHILLLISSLSLIKANAEEINVDSPQFPEVLSQAWYKVTYNNLYNMNSPVSDLYKLLWEFGHNEAEIVNTLGEPISRHTRFISNRHEPEHKIETVTLAYTGLLIEIQTTHHPKTFISRLFISNCDIHSTFQHYLCKPTSTLTNTFGIPSMTEGPEWVYTLKVADVGSTPIRIVTKDDSVSSIYLRNVID